MQKEQKNSTNANAPLVVEQQDAEYIIIQDYVESDEPYPVLFDEFWQWVGYSTKQKAEEALIKNFSLEQDFNFNQKVKVQIEGKRTVQRSCKVYSLTVDCAKSFAMLAQTAKGKEIRGYFLECEKKLQNIEKHLVTEQKFNTVLALIDGNFDKLADQIVKNQAENKQLASQVETLENEVEKLKLILDFKTLACVYVMFCPHRKLYKIGSTGTTKKREKNFQTVIRALEIIYQIPTLSCREAYKLETLLKERFTGKCREGEWYELDEADLAYIADLMYGSIEHLRTAKNL